MQPLLLRLLSKPEREAVYSVPPQILSSGFGNGDRDEFVFDLPSGSQRLTAVKIGNTGNDGWRLDTLSVRHRGATTQWPCDEW